MQYVIIISSTKVSTGQVNIETVYLMKGLQSRQEKEERYKVQRDTKFTERGTRINARGPLPVSFLYVELYHIFTLK